MSPGLGRVVKPRLGRVVLRAMRAATWFVVGSSSSSKRALTSGFMLRMMPLVLLSSAATAACSAGENLPVLLCNESQH